MTDVIDRLAAISARFTLLVSFCCFFNQDFRLAPFQHDKQNMGVVTNFSISINYHQCGEISILSSLEYFLASGLALSI